MSMKYYFERSKKLVEDTIRGTFGLEKPTPQKPPAPTNFIGQLWGMKEDHIGSITGLIPHDITRRIKTNLRKIKYPDNTSMLWTITPIFLYFVIPMVLVIVGSIFSVKSIPSTALAPTDAHPDYDPLDNNIQTDIEIVREKSKAQQSHHANETPKDDLSTDKMDAAIIMMPIIAAVLLIFMYYLFKIGILQTVTRLMRYLLLFETFSFVTQLVSLSGQWLVLFSTRKNGRDSKSILRKYRLTLSDDDANDRSNDASKFAMTVFPITNLNYVCSSSEDGSDDTIYAQKEIDELNKPGNGSLKKIYFRELAKPRGIVSKKQMYNLYFNWLSLLSYTLALLTCFTFYYNPNNWVVSNVVGMSTAVIYITHLRVPNLRAGVYLLLGLLIYDVFFVFATPIMETLATNIDIPAVIKLPNGTKNVGDASIVMYSLIGLGDIVLPGSFIAMCHRFDIWRTHMLEEETEFHLRKLPYYIGRYFLSTVIAYIVALLCCTAAMRHFKSAQPALLYISPALIIAATATAYFSGDLHIFWTFKYDSIKVPADSDSTTPLDNTTDKQDDTIISGYNSDEDDEEYLPSSPSDDELSSESDSDFE